MNICKCVCAFFAALLLVQAFFAGVQVSTDVTGFFGAVPARESDGFGK